MTKGSLGIRAFCWLTSGGLLSVPHGRECMAWPQEQKSGPSHFYLHRKQREKTGSEVNLSSSNGHHQGHTSSRKSVKSKGLVTSRNSATNWCKGTIPSIQIHNPMRVGRFSLSYHVPEIMTRY